MSPRSPARCELQPRSSRATRTPRRHSADNAATSGQCYAAADERNHAAHELQPRRPALRHARRRRRMQTPRELQPRSPRTSSAMQMPLPRSPPPLMNPAPQAQNAQPLARREHPGSAMRMPPPLFSHPPRRNQYECRRVMRTRMRLALRDANTKVQALSYGPRRTGAMRTPPRLPPDYKKTPGRRDAAPSPMRMLLRNPRAIRAPPTCAPNRFYASLLVWRLPAMVSAVY
ncbi:hypothetical protein B0H13DRAFT_2006540 [Mycena leptocephala]|nr:hypothetical protein B0H13DRAFT_2006540 [Mycena leptocephala]